MFSSIWKKPSDVYSVLMEMFFFISISATQQSEFSTVSYTVKTPCGVVGLITPWNLPVYLLSFKIAPAMAAGCCIVAKPSEMTSVTAWMLCQVFKDAGKVLDFNFVGNKAKGPISHLRLSMVIVI